LRPGRRTLPACPACHNPPRRAAMDKTQAWILVVEVGLLAFVAVVGLFKSR
jgi:hypothetical protein